MHLFYKPPGGTYTQLNSIFAHYNLSNQILMKKIFSFLIAISCLTSVAAQTKEQETAAVRKLGIA